MIRTSGTGLAVKPARGWPNSATGSKSSRDMSQSTKRCWAENAGREPGHDPPIDYAEPVSGATRVMTLAQVAFFTSVAVLAYTYAGYPLLLAVWAKLAPRPVRRAAVEPGVAIVVVVHNGAAFIGRKIASCLGQDYPPGHLR